MNINNDENCPKCGFSYAYDGNICKHCKPITEESRKKFSIVSIWKKPCRSCRKMVLRISCTDGRCRECDKRPKEQKRQKELNDVKGWLARCPHCNRVETMPIAATVLGKKKDTQYPCWRHVSLKFILLSTIASFGLALAGVGLLLFVIMLARDELGGKTFAGPGLHPGALYIFMGILPVIIIGGSFIAFIEGIVRTVGRLFYVIWSLKE